MPAERRGRHSDQSIYAFRGPRDPQHRRADCAPSRNQLTASTACGVLVNARNTAPRKNLWTRRLITSDAGTSEARRGARRVVGEIDRLAENERLNKIFLYRRTPSPALSPRAPRHPANVGGTRFYERREQGRWPTCRLTLTTPPASLRGGRRRSYRRARARYGIRLVFTRCMPRRWRGTTDLRCRSRPPRISRPRLALRSSGLWGGDPRGGLWPPACPTTPKPSVPRFRCTPSIREVPLIPTEVRGRRNACVGGRLGPSRCRALLPRSLPGRHPRRGPDRTGYLSAPAAINRKAQIWRKRVIGQLRRLGCGLLERVARRRLDQVPAEGEREAATVHGRQVGLEFPGRVQATGTDGNSPAPAARGREQLRRPGNVAITRASSRPDAPCVVPGDSADAAVVFDDIPASRSRRRASLSGERCVPPTADPTGPGSPTGARADPMGALVEAYTTGSSGRGTRSRPACASDLHGVACRQARRSVAGVAQGRGPHQCDPGVGTVIGVGRGKAAVRSAA